MDAPDAAEQMRLRLQADLRHALKARAKFDVSILRALIAAIDNAGAVDLTSIPQHSEVARRSLSASDVRELLRREHDTRSQAAAELIRLGLDAAASHSTLEMQFVSRYLALLP